MRHPKILLAFLLAIVVSFTSFAKVKKNTMGDVLPSDIFKIEFVNTPDGKITIGNKSYSKDGRFSASNPISWDNLNHYIDVVNTRNGNRYRISGHSYKDVKESSLNNYIRAKYTADKGGADFDKLIQSNREFLSQYTWDIIQDKLMIPFNLLLDDNHGIIFFSIPDDIQIVADYDDETNELIITSEMLRAKGIDPKQIGKYVFHVEYEYDGKRKALTDEFRMRYIP